MSTLHVQSSKATKVVKPESYTIYGDSAPSSTPVGYFSNILDKVGAQTDDYVIFRQDQYNTMLVWGDLESNGNTISGNGVVKFLRYTVAGYGQTQPTIAFHTDNNFSVNTRGAYSWVYSNMDYYSIYSVADRQAGRQMTNYILVSGFLVLFMLTFFGYGLKKRIWGSGRESRIR